MTRLAVGLALVVALTVPATTHAQVPADPKIAEARALVVEGNSLFQLGKFAEALQLYERAYRVRALPNTLFNIGQCYRQLKEFDKAIFSYRNYLLAVPHAPNRADVEALIIELESLAKKQGQATTRAPGDVKGPDVLPRGDRIANDASRDGGDAERPPWYKRWYVWTGVGAVIVGGVVTGVVLATRGGGSSTKVPGTDLGNMSAFGATR